MERIKAHLEDGKMAKSFDDINDEDEQQWLESYNLLTYKPVIFAANVAEDDLADDGASNAGVQAVREYAKERTAKYSLSVQRLSRRLRNLMMMKRACSWKNWDLRNLALKS